MYTTKACIHVYMYVCLYTYGYSTYNSPQGARAGWLTVSWLYLLVHDETQGGGSCECPQEILSLSNSLFRYILFRIRLLPFVPTFFFRFPTAGYSSSLRLYRWHCLDPFFPFNFFTYFSCLLFFTLSFFLFLLLFLLLFVVFSTFLSTTLSWVYTSKPYHEKPICSPSSHVCPHT